jgi:hypothetical protein
MMHWLAPLAASGPGKQRMVQLWPMMQMTLGEETGACRPCTSVSCQFQMPGLIDSNVTTNGERGRCYVAL